MRVLLAIVVLGVVVMFGARGWLLEAAEDLRADYRPTPASGELPGRYERVVEATYMARCQRDTRDVVYCRCTLEELGEKYRQPKFLKIEARLEKNPDGKLPHRVSRIIERCRAQSADS